MRFLDKLFGSDANDSTVQTGCNILKVCSVFTGLGNGKGDWGEGRQVEATSFISDFGFYCTCTYVKDTDSTVLNTVVCMYGVGGERGRKYLTQCGKGLRDYSVDGL